MEFCKFSWCCIVLVVCCLSQLASGLNCYMCTTPTSGGGCADDFDAYSGGVSNTTDSCDYCYKQKTKFGGRTFITRGCTTGNEADMKCWESDHTRGHWWETQQYDICYCQTDFCNGGNIVSSSDYLIVSVIFAMTLAVIKHVL